jgi:hypothetical protein
MTVYNEHHLFHPNPLGRYSLGTKSKFMQTNGDGSLTLHFGAKSPGKDKETNWVPAPEVVWGAGPLLLIPTSSDNISSDKWGLGPTAVVLKLDGPYTYGALVNHVWSVAGPGKQSISNTFLQPFLTYTTKSATSFTIQTEATYDWKNDQWNVPIALGVAQILKVGDQLLQLQAAARYYAESPAGGVMTVGECQSAAGQGLHLKWPSLLAGPWREQDRLSLRVRSPFRRADVTAGQPSIRFASSRPISMRRISEVPAPIS